MARRLTLDFKEVPLEGPDPQVATVSDLAVKIAGGKGPAIVRFVDSEALESTKDKELLKAVQASGRVLDLFKVNEQNVCLLARHFRLFCVCVDEVEPGSHPIVDRRTAPVVVVLDAQGKPVKVLTGSLMPADLLSAMAQALGAPLKPLLDAEQQLNQEVLDLDSLKQNLDAKREKLERAKGPEAARVEAEVKALEARLEEAQARIRERESKLLGGIR